VNTFYNFNRDFRNTIQNERKEKPA